MNWNDPNSGIFSPAGCEKVLCNAEMWPFNRSTSINQYHTLSVRSDQKQPWRASETFSYWSECSTAACELLCSPRSLNGNSRDRNCFFFYRKELWRDIRDQKWNRTGGVCNFKTLIFRPVWSNCCLNCHFLFLILLNWRNLSSTETVYSGKKPWCCFSLQHPDKVLWCKRWFGPNKCYRNKIFF